MCLMKEDGGQWLSISLFTGMENWHKALREIYSFMNLYYLRDSVLYVLEFNLSGGPNIRLAFAVNPDDAFSKIKRFHIHFKHYFAQFSQSSELIVPNKSSIFMNFPANSVHYGLFEIQEFASNYYSSVKVECTISELMLKLFMEEEVTQEKLLISSLYLHLTLISAFLKISNNKLDFITEFHKHAFDAANIELSILENEFLENIEILRLIKRDVFENDGDGEYDDWIDEWMQAFLFEFENLEIESATADFELYRSLRNCLNRRLGFNDATQSLVSFFIFKLFSKQ